MTNGKIKILVLKIFYFWSAMTSVLHPMLYTFLSLLTVVSVWYTTQQNRTFFITDILNMAWKHFVIGTQRQVLVQDGS